MDPTPDDLIDAVESILGTCTDLGADRTARLLAHVLHQLAAAASCRAAAIEARRGGQDHVALSCEQSSDARMVEARRFGAALHD